MSIDNRTEAQLIQEALDVQDACNLSGVVRSFHRSLQRLWRIADQQNKGTDWVNRHRVCRLFASKIESLAGEVELDDFNNNATVG